MIESRRKEDREKVRIEYTSLFNADLISDVEHYIPEEYRKKFKDLFDITTMTEQ